MEKNIFSVLAEPTRKTILEIIAKSGQISASDIALQFLISPQAISQHLKVLREANLVTVEKRAQQRIYRINPGPLKDMAGWVKQITSIWNDRFDDVEKVLQEKKIT